MELDAFDWFRHQAAMSERLASDARLMHSHETAGPKGRRILVMANMHVVSPDTAHRVLPHAYPLGYSSECRSFPDGFVRYSTDGPGWRPVIYRLGLDTTWRLGSQQELQFRYEVGAMLQGDLEAAARFKRFRQESMSGDDGDVDDTEKLQPQRDWIRDDTEIRARANAWRGAKEKARELLLEHLNGQQRLELLAFDSFHVRGIINPLYRIRLGNGLAIVRPENVRELVSICCHTDFWIPDEDNALAIKLAIESGVDGEQEILEAGNAAPDEQGARAPVYRNDPDVWEMYRRLIPGPTNILDKKGRPIGGTRRTPDPWLPATHARGDRPDQQGEGARRSGRGTDRGLALST